MRASGTCATSACSAAVSSGLSDPAIAHAIAADLVHAHTIRNRRPRHACSAGDRRSNPLDALMAATGRGDHLSCPRHRSDPVRPMVGRHHRNAAGHARRRGWTELRPVVLGLPRHDATRPARRTRGSRRGHARPLQRGGRWNAKWALRAVVRGAGTRPTSTASASADTAQVRWRRTTKDWPPC